MTEPRGMSKDDAALASEHGATFIYFVRSGEYIKIGQSRKWRSRIASMQTGSPHTIIVMLVIIGHPDTESKLHTRFYRDRFRGEWFHSSPAILKFIKENLPNCMSQADFCEIKPAELWNWTTA